MDLSLVHREMMRAEAALELAQANRLTERFGLTLSPRQIQRLAEKRFEALQSAGRVEFGRSVLRELVEAFCDSPFLRQEEYAETVSELIDSFYYFRGESDGLIPDGDLIDCMRRYFDEVCQGSLEFLNGATLADLIRGTRCARPIRFNLLAADSEEACETN